MIDAEIKSSLDRLTSYIEGQNFKGWDPYDLLNSPIPFRWFGKMAQAVVIQAGKLLPWSPRRWMFVAKGENPKGLGLMLNAYCNLYRVFKDERYLQKADYLFERLKAVRSQGYEEYCWGYNFVWANPQSVLAKYKPSSVVTAFVCQGVFNYHQLTGNPEAAEIIDSAAQYILKYLNVTETEHGICLSYTEEEKDCCYNASLLSGELLAMKYALTGDGSLLPTIKRILEFAIAHQQDDGHWNYSINLDTGAERKQVDFHQGFVLNSIYNICTNAGLMNDEIKSVLAKGLDFYRTKQFLDNGQSLWRIPKSLPVDIHNQAQGIITLSKITDNAEYHKFAETIMQWTMAHMQSRKGYFHYRIFRHYTIRTPFMRWSEAWMLLAFSELLLSNTKQ